MTGKYGPYTQQVEAVIERLKGLSFREAQALQAEYEATPYESRYLARSDARIAVMHSSHKEEWLAARVELLRSVWFPAYNLVWHYAWSAALDAILAIFARGLINPNKCDLLYGPWANLMGQGKGV